MNFDPILGAVRFGTGLSPSIDVPNSIEDLMAELEGADEMARAIQIEPFKTALPSPANFQELRRIQNTAPTEADEMQAAEAYKQLTQVARKFHVRNLMKTMARSVVAPIGLRERLTAFWADHFTTKGRNQNIRHLITPFIEEAIRPHVTGSFADMLLAVTTHPVMLLYLQQANSLGPTSPRGIRRGKGLNENLARELLELHSLGVDGGYSQIDVAELAELLTGLTFHPMTGFAFDNLMAEPGAETVLGVSYGPDASLQAIHNVLDDLARHPDTAQHIARKLAVHFVNDTPDTHLVNEVASVFRRTEGNLLATMEALLHHPASWAPEREKIRPPIEFITAAFRALDVPLETLIESDRWNVAKWIERPLRIMGQPFQDPVGPDGWPEAENVWITPQAMAGRINWAMHAPDFFLDSLPDPRQFAQTALGDSLPEAVVQAARVADTRSEGVALVLSSPSFQRR